MNNGDGVEGKKGGERQQNLIIDIWRNKRSYQLLWVRLLCLGFGVHHKDDKRKPYLPWGFTYAKFRSPECGGGLCRCGDQLQKSLEPWAVLGFVSYNVIWPLWLLWPISGSRRCRHQRAAPWGISGTPFRRRGARGSSPRSAGWHCAGYPWPSLSGRLGSTCRRTPLLRRRLWLPALRPLSRMRLASSWAPSAPEEVRGRWTPPSSRASYRRRGRGTRSCFHCFRCPRRSRALELVEKH